MLIKDNDKTAVCNMCGKRKPLGSFYIFETAGRLYASSLCRRCKREKVRMMYFLRNKGVVRKLRRVSREDEEDFDGVSTLFDVRGKVVFARLLWFDDRWHDEFTPVIEMESTAMCYKVISILKDLTTAELKQLRLEYLKTHGLEE